MGIVGLGVVICGVAVGGACDTFIRVATGAVLGDNKIECEGLR